MSELRLPEINRVILGGRLTRDPETRFAGDGTPITDFALAFHRRYRARDGQAAEETGFVAVRAYGRLAEVCGTYLKKGSPVLVEGRLQMREWKGAPGRQPDAAGDPRGERALHGEEPGGRGAAGAGGDATER